jgi:hypothetical protein
LHKTDNSKDKQKAAEEIEKLYYISYKVDPCDKMSFSIGYFLTFIVMGGSAYYSIMQS